MAMTMAMRRGAERAGTAMRAGDWCSAGPAGAGARFLATAVRVEDDGASSLSSSGRALAAFSALLGAGALYFSGQRTMKSEPAVAEATRDMHQECAPRTALNPNEFVQFKLAEVRDVNHNTKVYRFAFNPQEALGLHVASCLISKAEIGKKKDGTPNYIIRPFVQVFYVVSKESQGWKGGKGHVNKDVLIKGLPSPSDDTLILVCGPPGLMNLISGDKAPDKSQGELVGMLKELGYTPEQVYKF